jgi:hypothetical protein
MKSAPYQDKWRNGKLVRKGRRECAERYEAIAAALGEVLGEQYSLLDVGGWDGYFSRRFDEDGARVTMCEPRDVPDLQTTGIIHAKFHVGAKQARELPVYDAALLLAVLHHMPDWEEVYNALRSKTRVIVAELAVPEEVAEGRKLSPTLIDTGPRIGPSYERLTRDGELIHTTPGPNGVPRPIVLVRNFWRGQVEDGSGVASKYMRKPDPEHWEPLGYEPHPGTLNVHVGRAGRAWVSHLPNGVGYSTQALPAPYWPVWVRAGGEDMPAHARLSRNPEGAELVAPSHLRTALGLKNGDTVEIRVR